MLNNHELDSVNVENGENEIDEPEIKIRRRAFPKASKTETEMLKSVEKMLAGLAWSIAVRDNLEFAELQGQARFLAVKALRFYNPDAQVKFSTFCYTVVFNGLLTYRERQLKHCDSSREDAWQYKSDIYGENTELFNIMETVIPDESTSREHGFYEAFNSLSSNAQKIARAALQGKGHDLESLKNYAAHEWGMSICAFKKCRNELKTLVNSWG